ncbi:MAG: sensor histidine kinase [Candidatus Coproplasma sp.]
MRKLHFAEAIAFQVFLLISGSIVALSLSLCGVELGKELSIFPAITVALLFIILLIEIISVFKISDSTVHTVITAAALLACYISSSDFVEVLLDFGVRVDLFSASITQFAAYHAVMLANVNFLNYTYAFRINRKGWATILACAIIACVLYGALSLYGFQYIAFALWLPVYAIMHVKAYLAVAKSGNVNRIFFLTTTVMSASTGMQLVEELGVAGFLTCNVSGFATAYNMLIISVFGIIYLTFILKTESNSLKAEEYRLQAELLKTKVLQQQINPHYIYNSLTTVKEMYHQNCEDGDNAINLFAKHLRANVNGMTTELISFDEEIEIIQNYLGFENLKREKPVEVIYNIEYSDFRVPPLSLQVFVENAVKHGKVGDKPDGVIEISAFEQENEIIVEISDNGAGFDIESINPESCGIANSRARLSLLLGGSVEIDSAVGNGTRVRIKLDKRTAALPDGSEEGGKI